MASRSASAAAALAAALAAAALLTACSEEAWNAAKRPRAGDGVEVIELRSEAVGAEFTIYVGLPESYESGAMEYPLVFMTDGDSDFSAIRKRTLESMRVGRAREFILAGIGYGAGSDCRNRDYTPTRDAAWEREQDPGGRPTGGAPAFLRFISDELRPLLEERYRVAAGRDGRCLIGHSLGGLLALYAAVERPDEFGSIVASSPSTYWDSRVIFRFLAEGPASRGSSPAVRLFASDAAHEGFPSDVELDEWVARARALPSFSVERRRYEDAVHLEVWKKSMPDGLEAVFGAE